MKKLTTLITALLLVAAGVIAYAERTSRDSRSTIYSDIEAELGMDRPAENVLTIKAGQRLFKRRCAICHGIEGDGKGEGAYMLQTKPRDFTAGVYKFRSTPTGSLPSDEDLYITITRGIRGTAMVPQTGLTASEKWSVIYYIKTLSGRFSREEHDTLVKIPEAGSPVAELIKKGQAVYDRARCWECHGTEGRGNGPKAEKLRDDWGYRISPRDFKYEPFKRGLTTEDIFLTVTTGLDGTPMASFGDSLNKEELLSVAAYVKSLQRYYRGSMMGMMSMTPDERAGMMIEHHSGGGCRMSNR